MPERNLRNKLMLDNDPRDSYEAEWIGGCLKWVFSILSIDGYMDRIIIRTLSDIGGLFSGN